jgi:hypothetical protein
MNMAMTLGNFMSDSYGEILGIYSPGRVPIVKVIDNLPGDVTLAHELGHKQLCDATSLGQYIVALALAATDESLPKHASNALSEVIEQCWLVQEGYATLRQLAHCRLINRLDLIQQIENNLPPAYKSALAHFWVDAEDLGRRVTLAMGHLPQDTRQHMIGVGLEYGAWVIAKAAMSIPIAQLLSNAESLPSHEVSVAIRRNAPDHRLETLHQKVTADFAWRCLLAFLVATSSDSDAKTSRPLDNLFDAITRQVCEDTGLTYEPSDAVDLTRVLTKLGCHMRVEFLDGRDVDRDKMRDYQNDTAVLGANSQLPDLAFVHLDDAEREFAGLFETVYQAATPHIVCEIGPKLDDGTADIFIHTYCTKTEYLQVLGQANVGKQALAMFATTDPKAAMQLLLLASKVAVSEVPTLPLRFRHQRWNWIVADALIGGKTRLWNLQELQERGDVYATPLFRPGFHNMSIQATYAVPKTPTEEGPDIEGLGYLGGIPDHIGLNVFESDELKPNIRVVSLTILGNLRDRNLPVAPFEYACVADSLFQGFYSQLLSKKLKG